MDVARDISVCGPIISTRQYYRVGGIVEEEPCLFVITSCQIARTPQTLYAGDFFLSFFLPLYCFLISFRFANVLRAAVELINFWIYVAFFFCKVCKLRKIWWPIWFYRKERLLDKIFNHNYEMFVTIPRAFTSLQNYKLFLKRYGLSRMILRLSIDVRIYSDDNASISLACQLDWRYIRCRK